jgi:hypothetical protein
LIFPTLDWEFIENSYLYNDYSPLELLYVAQWLEQRRKDLVILASPEQRRKDLAILASPL